MELILNESFWQLDTNPGLKTATLFGVPMSAYVLDPKEYAQTEVSTRAAAVRPPRQYGAGPR